MSRDWEPWGHTSRVSYPWQEPRPTREVWALGGGGGGDGLKAAEAGGPEDSGSRETERV